MSLPKVVSRDEWLSARKELLAEEKAMTLARDELNVKRRLLPMVRVEKDYVFHGADELSEGLLSHLHARETTLVVVARAQFEKLERYRAEHGWTFPVYSSYGSDFNYDYHVTLDESIAPVEYNYRTKAEHEAAGTPGYVEGERPVEQPGESYFLRDGGDVFHTYSVYARGAEATGGSYYFLDQTALGRQEEWEEPKGRAVDPHGAIPDFAT